ncbi:MAG TPA: hypothetical protein DEP38_03445 [Cyanobacteria bacterium UBA9226]|nr:hypothetical protein [Cyanobacteria bacterium UBA9226]
MNNKLPIAFFITTLLMTGYPTMETVEAQSAKEATQSIWKPFSSAEGGFTLLMPGTPKPVEQNLNTPNGRINLKGFMVQRRNEANYLVIYTDLPSKTIENDKDIEELFDGIVEGFQRRTRGELVNEENITLNNFPGREFKMELSGNITARSRVYLVNQRLYQLVVVTPREEDLPQSIQGFLDSFQVNRSTGNPTAANPTTGNPTTANPTTPTPPKIPKEDLNSLNIKLRQAICSQKLSEAIKILDRMIAIAPNPSTERSQLVAYRSQLRDIADSATEIPPNAFPDCKADSAP